MNDTSDLFYRIPLYFDFSQAFSYYKLTGRDILAYWIVFTR